MFRATFFSLALIAMSNPTLADEVTDTLSSALQAYEDGDIDYALEELEYARQLLQAMATQELSAFLPEPPAGWTREVSENDMTPGLAMIGGGAAVEADYTDGAERFSITIVADSPMVTMLAGMVSNATMLGMKLHRVGREKFVDNDGELMGLVGNRVVVQAEGAAPEVMLPVLETIDFKALEAFGG